MLQLREIYVYVATFLQYKQYNQAQNAHDTKSRNQKEVNFQLIKGSDFQASS